MNNAATATAITSLPTATFVPTVSWTEMVSHRGYLVRFAQRKLRDPLLAEDAVHDVFEAVLSGRAVFAGRAALRSSTRSSTGCGATPAPIRSKTHSATTTKATAVAACSRSNARSRARTRSPNSSSC